MRLSVDVNQCTLPQLPYHQYSLAVRIGPIKSAATSFKPKIGEVVHFDTKLFFKTQKEVLQKKNHCFLILTAMSVQGKIEIAKAEVNPMIQVPQNIKLSIFNAQHLIVDLNIQFHHASCQTQNRCLIIQSLKSKERKKYSSSQQIKGIESNQESSTTNDSKPRTFFESKDKESKHSNKEETKIVQNIQSSKEISYQKKPLESFKQKINSKPFIPKSPKNHKVSSLKAKLKVYQKNASQNHKKNSQNKSDSSSLGSVTMQLDILIEPSTLPIYSRNKQYRNDTQQFYRDQ